MPEGYKKVIYNLVAYQLSKENWDTETEHIQLDASYSNGELQFIAVYEPIIIEKEHTWDDGTITKAADCTTEGIKQYKCKNCDETKEEFIQALGHKIVTDMAVPATCTANGLTEGIHCSVCKTVLTKQQTVKPIGHKAVIDKNVPSTCLTDGKTIGSHCSVCNETLEKQETVSATGHSFDDGKITQFPTCTEDGIKTYYCNNCNEIKTEIIAKTDHTYKTTTTKATTKKNGSKVTKCSVCGAKKTSSTINAVKTITLSKTSYVYNGEAQKPSATVKDSKGKKIASSNYTVKYSNNKNVGIATVTITFKGNYSGIVKKTFTIKPKATTLSKVTAGKKKFTVKWKKQTTQTTGYQIQYSTNSKFTSAKTITASNSKTISKTVSKLKAKKKYYVRVRTYKIVGKTKICSSWSIAKSIKTK
ncbi:MAG: fibronectin type III domain-containing protein [Eubacterium sp.]|nr:fibronectin type III domain-containing protein [Eubacterium sp.]